MEQELKNDLIATWSEIEETITSINELTDEELIDNKKALLDRLDNALYWLGKYVNKNDVIELL